jgi:hypothetical protein
MKKLLLSALITFGIYSAALAQNKNTIEFGVNAGLSSSTMQNNSIIGQGFQSKISANFGVSGEYYFSDRWGIKAKAIYDQKGWSGSSVVSVVDGSEMGALNYHLNYLTIPVMANWHFGKNRNWYLDFGPYVGFLLNKDDRSQLSSEPPAFKSTDAGIALGIGVKIPIYQTARLFFEYDAQGGITSVYTPNEGIDKNARSSLNVGLLFPIK